MGFYRTEKMNELQLRTIAQIDVNNIFIKLIKKWHHMRTHP